MRISYWPLVVVFALAGCGDSGSSGSGNGDASSSAKAGDSLTRVVRSKGVQLTGLTVSKEGRVFVNFPRWRGIPYSVVELTDSGFEPYPNDGWNHWNADQADTDQKAFVSVQSVVADSGDLWVLDPASPGMQGVVGAGAKLVRIDLASDRVSRIYHFNASVAPEKSYLNDVRIDEEHGYAYITDSGLGGVVVLNLETGEQHRYLADHASTRAEDITLTMDGEPLTFVDGGRPQIHSDGIALDEQADQLYYHALTGYHLYRLPTKVLRNSSLTAKDRAAAVENLGRTPAPDGMIFGPKGNLYMADLENNAVVYRTPAGSIRTLVRDDRLRWPDTFSIGPDGWLYFTDSRIQDTEWFDQQAKVDELSFPVYKVRLPERDESGKRKAESRKRKEESRKRKVERKPLLGPPLEKGRKGEAETSGYLVASPPSQGGDHSRRVRHGSDGPAVIGVEFVKIRWRINAIRDRPVAPPRKQPFYDTLLARGRKGGPPPGKGESEGVVTGARCLRPDRAGSAGSRPRRSG